MKKKDYFFKTINKKNSYKIGPAWTKGKLRFQFGLSSDQHVSGTDVYPNSKANCIANYSLVKRLGANFIANCGDNTVYGTEENWQAYVSCLSQAGWDRANVHEAVGNHEFECSSSMTDCYVIGEQNYRRYSNNGSLQNTEKPYFYLDLYGDRFIFIYITGRYPRNDLNLFTTTQLDWLEQTISSYNGNGNVWIIEHAPFREICPGDDPFSFHYPNQMPTEQPATYPLNTRFRSIVTANYNNAKNVFFCHGHTHILPENCKDYTIPIICSPENADGCFNVHVPSGTATRVCTSKTGTGSSYTSPRIWFVKVYEYAVEFILYNSSTGGKVQDMTYLMKLRG